MKRNDYIAGILELCSAAGITDAEAFGQYVMEMITFSDLELESIHSDLYVEFGSLAENLRTI